jgi:hypothetical protein
VGTMLPCAYPSSIAGNRSKTRIEAAESCLTIRAAIHIATITRDRSTSARVSLNLIQGPTRIRALVNPPQLLDTRTLAVLAGVAQAAGTFSVLVRIVIAAALIPILLGGRSVVSIGFLVITRNHTLPGRVGHSGPESGNAVCEMLQFSSQKNPIRPLPRPTSPQRSCSF